ncbi:probable flavin-containing monooxygenase 1 [Tanacetum coccineum]
MASEKQVAIVGAGISGLLACKHLMEKGFRPVVFESRGSIGGVWAHQTIESTKLQTPKDYYQFSDWPWARSVTEAFPDHNQVLEYINSYADYFDLAPMIKFNHKVVAIDYSRPLDNYEISQWDEWSGNGKWKMLVQNTLYPLEPPKVYEVDFVILCSGNYSDFPNVPQFPTDKGPEVFDGVALHSMDYAMMSTDNAAEFIKDNRVTVVGFQKSAVDIAVEVAKANGVRYPCTMVFKAAYWMIPEHLNEFNFKKRNRFSELMIHKPHEGFFFWLLAILLYPLMVGTCEVLEEDTTPIPTDIVIFATGFRSDESFAKIFKSVYFQSCILGSSAPFYRECIQPRIPQLAILGYSESPTNLFTTETRSKWLSHLIAGNIKLPTIQAMEEDTSKWETFMRKYHDKTYKRSCITFLLQIHFNDLLCKDMGFNPRRKSWFIPELFAPYVPTDYANL